MRNGMSHRSNYPCKACTFFWLMNLPTGGSLMRSAVAADTTVTATPHMVTGHRQLIPLRMVAYATLPQNSSPT